MDDRREIRIEFPIQDTITGYGGNSLSCLHARLLRLCYNYFNYKEVEITPVWLCGRYQTIAITQLVNMDDAQLDDYVLKCLEGLV